MPTVLAHRAVALTKDLRSSVQTSIFLAFQSYSALFITFVSFLYCVHGASGQVLINGQTFTNGLAIIDAPNPSSTFQAGSNMPIAIDVSGDGNLLPAASVPTSGLATRYNSLEIYLVSSQANSNLTVSSGTGLLTQESGSTVKHLDFNIPSCVSAGEYNLTFYECSHINNTAFFTISPIPVQITNPNPSGACQSNVNPFLGQPQSSSPAPQNPFLPSDSKSPIGSATVPTSQVASTTGGLTSAVTPTTAASGAASGMVTVFTGIGTSGLATIPGLLTVTITAGDLPWPLSPYAPTGSVATTVVSTATVSVTPSPISVTVVVISMETVTSTHSDQTGVQTTTVTSISTTTAAVNAPSDFFPVNAAPTAFFVNAIFLVGLLAASSVFILW